MTRKTESLSYPKNPLAAMRELQELDALPQVNRNHLADEPPTAALATTLPTSSATSSAVAHANCSDAARATSSAVGSVDSSEESSATGGVPGQPRRRQGTRAKAGPSGDESEEAGGPLAKAVREMLAQPYTADLKRGPFTVSTVKIPTEVSERLGWVATLTGKAKQEILTEALKDYFARVLNEG